MVNISEDLKQAFNPNGGEGGRTIAFEVRLEVFERTIRDNLLVSAAQDASISRLSQVIDNEFEPINFASYEGEGFPLDGSVVVPPRVTERPDLQVGLIEPVLSDANGYFAAAQLFTAELPEASNVIAVSLYWGYTVASDFTVRWYNGAALLKEVSVTGNALAVSLVNMAVADVTKITVSVSRTLLPYRRMRLAEFLPGAILTYNNINSESLSLDENIVPLNDRVAADTLTLVTSNFARDFNIFEPEGIYIYFQNRMLITAKIGALKQDGALEYLQMGDYYLQAPALKGNLSLLELKATDMIGILQESLFKKGSYRQGSIASFADEIAADAGVRIIYPAWFYAFNITSYNASTSHALAFCQIARATNTILYTDREDNIVFAELENDPLQTLDELDYDMNGGFSPSDDTIINTVEVEFASLSTSDELSELARVQIAGNFVSVGFYVDTAFITTTAGIQEVSYSPSIGQTITQNGSEITIKGYNISKTTSKLKVTNKRETDKEHIYTVSGNPFIQASNVADVANYFLTLKAAHRRIVKMNYRGYPYFNMGDIVNFKNSGNLSQPFFITKNSLKLGGGMTGTLEARER